MKKSTRCIGKAGGDFVMKRIVSILLVLCLALSAAACSRAGSSAQDKYVAVIRQAVQDGDTEKAQGALQEALQRFPESEALLELQAQMNASPAIAQDQSPSLEPTQEDLDSLCTIAGSSIFFGTDYDCEKDNILDFLYGDALLFSLLSLETVGILRDGENLFKVYRFAGDENKNGDPLGHFSYSYVRVQEDVLNDCMENVFCNTVYKTHTTGYDADKNVGYYLHDGWYYFELTPSGEEDVDYRAGDFTKQKNGHLLVNINRYGYSGVDDVFDELDETVAVDAVLHEADGVRTWSIYSIRNVPAAVTTGAAPKDAVPTEAQVMEQFLQLRALYRQWYTNAVSYNETLKISVSNPNPDGYVQALYAYRINDPHMQTAQALRDAFLAYGTPEYYNSISSGQTFDYCDVYITYSDGPGGGLYVCPDENVQFYLDDEDYEVTVRKLSDDAFEVRFMQCIFYNDGSPSGNYEYDRGVQRYSRTNGGYRFGPVQYEEKIFTTYFRYPCIVTTESSDLNVHSIPSQSKESVVGSIPKGTVVTAMRVSKNWVGINAEVGGKEIVGWVRAEYLREIG